MEQLLDQLRELGPWHMDLEIAPGVRTSAGNREQYEDPDLQNVKMVDPFELKRIFDRVYPGGLQGRSFLDVGCNAGGYCFVAKSVGAGRTLGFDVRDHWIRQAEFLRVHWPGETSGMEFRVTNLGEIDLGEGFDVTLFKGVFYHLPDPVGALLKLCAASKELIIVDTASRSDIPENAMMTRRESTSHVMSGVDGLAWLPGGPQAIIDILEHGGFPAAHVVYWEKEIVASPENWGRFRVVAARDPKTFAES